MLRRSFLTILLCGALSAGALAEPIAWNQVERGSMAASLDSLPVFGQGQLDQPSRAEESPNHPEFVRLPDGRIVPYGPGVICNENCVENFSGSPHSRRWLVIPPIIV